MLMEEYKANYMAAALAFLEYKNDIRSVMAMCIVTGDETWVHYYTPNKNNKASSGVRQDKSLPKKPKLNIQLGMRWRPCFGIELGLC